ncbi:MAG TPA: MBL fold metallo-hydrolase [Anaeromyxobacteraceae bacterium]|nr:MBL fold metallo-hydrolase [Anaeromyxobacteraceae bacterium]
MIVEVAPVGPLRANCHILVCERKKEAVVVDPGGEAGQILQKLHARDVSVKYVLNTHGHFDHVGANRRVLEATGAVLLIHECDAFFLSETGAACFAFGEKSEPSPTPGGLLANGQKLRFGKYLLEVLHTPGHSPGGCCFHCEEEGVLFTGDTLFNGSIGRWDLPGGCRADLVRSIREKLFALRDATIVYPGHGPSTTIGLEKSTNLCIPRG